MGGRIKDLSGKKFNMFTIKGLSDKRDYNGGPLWICECECGNIKYYRTVRAKNTISCGCINSSNITNRFKREYETWKNIKQRCHNPKNPKYYQYGARGIEVCERWRKNFFDFLRDMGERPKGNYSIERIDNNKGYSSDNCKWATTREQSLNKRKNKNNTSGYTGVTARRGKWMARIENKGVKHYLGTFDNIDDAIEARKDAELKYYGRYINN